MASGPTTDPDVTLESSGKTSGVTWWVYRRNSTGQRWRIDGNCDRRGDCMIGAVIIVNGSPVTIESKQQIQDLVRTLGRSRIDAEIDVPVLPGFEGCCPLVGTWL